MGSPAAKNRRYRLKPGNFAGKAALTQSANTGKHRQTWGPLIGKESPITFELPEIFPEHRSNPIGKFRQRSANVGEWLTGRNYPTRSRFRDRIPCCRRVAGRADQPVVFEVGKVVNTLAVPARRGGSTLVSTSEFAPGNWAVVVDYRVKESGMGP